jgi:hypothetical protein
MTTSDRTWNECNWNAYVVSGPNKAERARRLAQCPAEWRDAVRSHVTCAFRIKAEAAKLRAKAAKTAKPS